MQIEKIHLAPIIRGGSKHQNPWINKSSHLGLRTQLEAPSSQFWKCSKAQRGPYRARSSLYWSQDALQTWPERGSSRICEIRLRPSSMFSEPASSQICNKEGPPVCIFRKIYSANSYAWHWSPAWWTLEQFSHSACPLDFSKPCPLSEPLKFKKTRSLLFEHQSWVFQAGELYTVPHSVDFICFTNLSRLSCTHSTACFVCLFP